VLVIVCMCSVYVFSVYAGVHVSTLLCVPVCALVFVCARVCARLCLCACVHMRVRV